MKPATRKEGDVLLTSTEENKEVNTSPARVSRGREDDVEGSRNGGRAVVELKEKDFWLRTAEAWAARRSGRKGLSAGDTFPRSNGAILSTEWRGASRAAGESGGGRRVVEGAEQEAGGLV